jgi:hypothetical protein
MQRRVLVRTALALSTAIAILCLATEALADTIISASNNATIQTGGPRAGTNGKIFFNIEGSSNGSFSDFGVVDFQTPSGVTFGPGQELSLALTQDNAAFTANGSLAFYVSTDTTTGIEPGTSPLAFHTTSLPPDSAPSWIRNILWAPACSPRSPTDRLTFLPLRQLVPQFPI